MVGDSFRVPAWAVRNCVLIFMLGLHLAEETMFNNDSDIEILRSGAPNQRPLSGWGLNMGI